MLLHFTYNTTLSAIRTALCFRLENAYSLSRFAPSSLNVCPQLWQKWTCYNKGRVRSCRSGRKVSPHQPLDKTLHIFTSASSKGSAAISVRAEGLQKWSTLEMESKERHPLAVECLGCIPERVVIMFSILVKIPDEIVPQQREIIHTVWHGKFPLLWSQ